MGSFTRLDGADGEVNGNQRLVANLALASNSFYREYADRIELSWAGNRLRVAQQFAPVAGQIPQCDARLVLGRGMERLPCSRP